MTVHCGICDKMSKSLRIWYGNFLCNKWYNTYSIRESSRNLQVKLINWLIN